MIISWLFLSGISVKSEAGSIFLWQQKKNNNKTATQKMAWSINDS